MSPATPSRDEAERRKRDLEEEKKKARIALDEATRNLGLAVEAVYVDPHPRSVLRDLRRQHPILASSRAYRNPVHDHTGTP